MGYGDYMALLVEGGIRLKLTKLPSSAERQKIGVPLPSSSAQSKRHL